jgi:large subunit ribosomal protein L24
MRIKVGDTVHVIAGDEKGQNGKVIRVLTSKDKIVVEGVNKVFKHVKRSQKNPQGGRLSMEMPIHVSNVKLVCSATGKPSRVGMRMTSGGAKERFCKVSGASAGIVTPSKDARAAGAQKKTK